MPHPELVEADLNLVVWLVVVVGTLISQVARASRQRPGQGPPPGTRPPRPPQAPHVPMPESDAQRELEQFLASLAGVHTETKPPSASTVSPGPPVTRAVPVPTPPRQPPAHPQHIPQRPAPVRKAVPRSVDVSAKPFHVPEPPVERRPHRVIAPPAPAALAAADADPYSHAAIARSRAKSNALHQVVTADLRHRAALRKAMVLRELLDPPLALREEKPRRW